AACSLDDLRNPQSRSTLKGQEQAESRGTLTRGSPQVAKPAPAPLSTYQVSGVVGDSPGPIYQQESNTENYLHYDDQPVKITLEAPVSTFSVDVDTVSYANVRRFLNNGQLPPKDAVRAE